MKKKSFEEKRENYCLGRYFHNDKFIIDFFSLQDSFPLRFQGFHFINEPFYLYTVYSIIKPFLKEKMRCRVRYYFVYS